MFNESFRGDAAILNKEFGARYHYSKPSYPHNKGFVNFKKQTKRGDLYNTVKPECLQWEDRNIDPRSREAKASDY